MTIMTITQSDVIRARFAPRNPDALIEPVRALVGQEFNWLAVRPVELGEFDGIAEGDWLMRLMTDGASLDFVPLSDLDVTT